MKKYVNRTYRLKIYANPTKAETARYSIARMNQYINMFLGRLYFNGNKLMSTKNMGGLANDAQYKAKNIINAHKKAIKKTNNKSNVPVVSNCGCIATIKKSDNSTFDYWVRVVNQWGGRPVMLPAKSHIAFNRALKNGWEIIQRCECKIVKGHLYAFVFVKKEKPELKTYDKTTGVDVGIKHSITTSEGHYGYGLSGVIKKQKKRYAERRRQNHKISCGNKSEIKQLLDLEAKRLMRRSLKSKVNIAVESPNRLANLRSGRLQGWARSYFANRLHILGQENGVAILDIHPYQTSQTCSKCGNVDKRSRVNRDEFHCVSCGYKAQADYNASVVISQKGTQILKGGKNE